MVAALPELSFLHGRLVPMQGELRHHTKLLKAKLQVAVFLPFVMFVFTEDFWH